MDRAAKRELVTSLNTVLKDTGLVVVAHYAGMTVAQLTDYRQRVKEAGGKVKVAKNRLAKLALKDTSYEAIADLFKGQTCVAYSKDPIAAAKASVTYAKGNEKLVILGGAMGATVLDANGRQSARRTAIAGRAQSQADRSPQRAGDEDRPHGQGAGSQARTRHSGEGGTRRGRITARAALTRRHDMRTRSSELHAVNRFKPEGSNNMTDLSKIVDDLSKLTVLQAAELAKMLEEKWGVSAAAAVAVAAAPGAAAAAVEEQTEFTVILKAGGEKKINVIKEVRAITGPWPQGSQGPRRGRRQGREGRRVQGRGRQAQEAARGPGRDRRSEVSRGGRQSARRVGAGCLPAALPETAGDLDGSPEGLLRVDATLKRTFR